MALLSGTLAAIRHFYGNEDGSGRGAGFGLVNHQTVGPLTLSKQQRPAFAS
jgi:hypothetical protein